MCPFFLSYEEIEYSVCGREMGLGYVGWVSFVQAKKLSRIKPFRPSPVALPWQ